MVLRFNNQTDLYSWQTAKRSTDMQHELFSRQGVVAASIMLIGSMAASGCTTTSDVTSMGNGVYMTTAAACPACGGTSKSASLAATKANEYCATTGKKAVLESVESKNLNAVGAGASQVAFRCVEDTSEDEIQACYDNFIAEIGSEYGAELGGSVLGKLMNYNSFDQLADTSTAKPEEVPVLQAAGRGVEECESKAIASMSSGQASLQESYLRKTLELIAKLSTGAISYGDYSSGMNANEAALEESRSKVAVSEREEARWQAEQRMRSMENMSDEINRIMSPK